MSSGEQEQQQAAEAQTTEAQESLLEQAIAATPQTDRNRAEELIKALVDEANAGVMSFDKDMSRTINQRIAAIDAVISKQLGAIMHHPDFQKLEGTWRGLNHLVMNSETGEKLKIRAFNCNKRELFKDLDKAVEFDQSMVFKKIYEGEFGVPGGTPYGALIGDYQFTNHPEDIDTLQKMSGVAASAFAPFLTSPAPEFFGYKEWTELPRDRDLAKIFEAKEYTKWNAFRDSDDSRFVTMCMPRTLARLPYGELTKTIDEFEFEEVEVGVDASGGKYSIPVDHSDYCWMNTAYVMGAQMTAAFSQTGWCTAIRGAENGGKVDGLDVHVYKGEDGDSEVKCPTETLITDRREAELSKLGFLSLCHYKDKDYSVFFGAQTTQRPKKYDRPAATANAAISARLPYIMATSRIAHYLKVIARDWVGAFMEREDCEKRMTRWIMNYVSADDNPSPEQRARYPLAEAQIEVKEVDGQPGVYNAVAHLRPWLQMEELNASLRLVAKLPPKAG